ncbi:MAG: hypothetical protein SOV90_01155 [Lachnospiraceae bacterium]|nr:hypothetical protein [Lachnospiraceae bacterium]
MRRIVTDEIMNNMLLDYNNGLGLTQLSQKYNFQEQTIQNNFKKYGIKISKSTARKFTQDEVDNIIIDYTNGLKPYELAKKYDRNSGTIIGKLQSLGIYKNSIYHFTKEDIEFLKIHYPNNDWEKIYARFPNTTKASIQTKMNKLNIHTKNYFWTDSDIELLKNNYPHMNGNIKDLVKLFDNRYTYTAIMSKAQKLGLKAREYWSEKEISIIKNNYHLHTVDEMMKLLPNRSRNSIIAQAKNLGVTNKTIIESNFSKEEKQFVYDNYNKLTDKEIGDRLNRSSYGINNYRSRNGLLKIYEKSSYLDLSEYVRRNNIQWKKASMENCNYKCIITGKRFDDIHHLYGLNLILNETLDKLNIKIRNDINDYTQEELNNILSTFRKIQSNYPLGVCLTKEIHKKFHEVYGYGNNTEEQWNDFVKNYNKIVD